VVPNFMARGTARPPMLRRRTHLGGIVINPEGRPHRGWPARNMSRTGLAKC
jgi:hypothetical protein